jgi:glucan 1,3-beta-glucosidase
MSYHGSYDNFRSEAPPSPHFSAYNPPRSPVQHSQPDLDSMPPEAIPLSREGLPPGARQPRFYGLAANDDSYNPRASIASSSEFDPRAQYGGGGYQHSEYGSVSRLPIGSAGQSTATLVPPGQMYQNYYKDNYYKDEGYQSDSVPMTNMGQSRFTHQDLSDKRDLYASPAEKKSKAGKLTAMIGVGVLVVAAAVVIPLYFFVFRHKSDTSTTPSSNNTTSSNTTHSNILTTGGDGSIVTLEDGTNFTYHNSFGGFWVWNPDNPFNNSAQPQSWSPPLSQQWNWGVDTIRG